MPLPNLFEIDPDKLFEQCSIEEIQATQIKLQHEIERKREELRTMVGERYRDLIEAADKITEMKDISKNVIKDIEGVSAAMDQLQLKSVKNGFLKKQRETVTHRSLNSTNITLEQVAVQLKLLIELPEHIWTALDRNEYATATQLYMLGRYIKTGLEIDPIVRTNSSPGYISNCPLLDRQWVAMSEFKDCILKSVGVALQEETIDPESACGCFISIAVLENKNSKEVVEYFLSLRMNALQNIILNGLESNEDTMVTKLRFIKSHIIVISTMMTLYSCFIEYPGEMGDGVLWRNVRKIIGRDSTPVIKILATNHQENEKTIEVQSLYHLLPSIISNYRCCPECALEPLPPSEMSAVISDWLSNVTCFIKESGKALLDKLCTLRSLQGLRDANQDSPEEWSLVLQRLMQPSTLNIWNYLYIPLIINRAKQLITVHWQASLKHMKEQITAVIKEVLSKSIPNCPENDLHWYIWKESVSDLTFANQPQRSSHQLPQQPVRGVWLKSQGITPRVAELCNSFETQLSTLLNDLSTLYPSGDNSSIDGDDSKSLLSHQCTQCIEVLTQLVMFVKNEVDKSEGDIVPLLLARFLQSIIKLCPTLQKCLTGPDLKVNIWQEACDILTLNTNHCWSVWRSRILEMLEETITSSLLPPKKLKDLLNMIPQWDVVNIEEVGEAGQTISSDLRIPSSPSFQLLSVLSAVCTTVSNALVPTYVTELLVNELVVKIIFIYKGMITEEPVTLVCTSKFWQLLYDIKYITAALVQHDNKPLLSQCQEVISLLEKNIDPFDLDVFTPYINNNIRRSQRQTQSALGVLVVARVTAMYLSSNSTNVGQPHSHTEDPSVLAVSSTASSTWFSLLPVTAPPGTRAINPAKVKVPKTSNVEQSQDTQQMYASKSAVTSSATSFFGSMTSDWFG